MTKNQRGFEVGGAWLSAGFALLLGCSASDGTSTDEGSNQEALRRPSSGLSPHNRPTRHGNGHGHGHGHGHDDGHGHGHDDGHGGPGSGSGGGGGSSSGGSGSSSGGSGTFPTGGTSSSGGQSSGGTGFAGSGSGGFGGGFDPGICGDGMYGGYEQCDDGNASSGDGCSSLCQLEPNYACDYVGEPCQPVVCGDGLQQSYVQQDGTYAYESCDDGNVAAGDGCGAACGLEPGWICEQPGTPCREPVCGDGRQDSWFVPEPGGGTGGSGTAGSGSGGGGPGGTYYYEECDDGNSASEDGCTSSCTVEAGWLCSEPGVACRQPVCGDGFVDFIASGGSGGSSSSGGSAGTSGGTGNAGTGFGGAGGGSDPGGFYEGCDDGGTVPGDGCDSSCSVEAGWSCPYWAGPCHVIVCGDGWADYPDEECDDANTIPNDGCTSCRYDFTGGGGFGNGGFSNGGFGGGG